MSKSQEFSMKEKLQVFNCEISSSYTFKNVIDKKNNYNKSSFVISW